MSFARLFRVLSREPGRPGSILGRPDAPGLDFGGRNATIFARFRCARAFAAYFARRQQNTVKTDTKSTSELTRDKTTTQKNRSDDASDSACRAARAPTSLRTVPGASWARPGVALGRLSAALGAPGAAQDRSWAVFGESRARPERAPTRPRNGFGRPKAAKSDFSTIFRRFGLVFRPFSSDFSSIFALFSSVFDAAPSAFVRALLALLCCLSLPERRAKRKR